MTENQVWKHRIRKVKLVENRQSSLAKQLLNLAKRASGCKDEINSFSNGLINFIGSIIIGRDLFTEI